MVVSFSAFADYFSVHRGLAVGTMASGSGLGSLVVPKLLSYLFDNYTFRNALIFYGKCTHEVLIFIIYNFLISCLLLHGLFFSCGIFEPPLLMYLEGVNVVSSVRECRVGRFPE